MSKEKLIDLDQEQLDLLHAILKQHIPNKTVWAYGSRVTWKAGETSDLDLAVFDCTPMEIYHLKEALEESDLLISVDVMDWESIPDDFKENIRGKYVVLQESQSKSTGWKEVRLGDFLDVKHGYAFKGQFITDQENNNILVTPGNFKIGGGFKSSKLKYFTGQIPQDYILKEDDIIVTMTDLSKNGDTLGYSAKVPKTKTGKIFLHNQRIGLLQFKSDVVDQDFIYWLLRTSDYHWFTVGAASGTSIKHTSPTAIKEYKFSLPPLPEQKAIAEALSSLDDKIDLLHRQNKTLEDMAQALFRKSFTGNESRQWDTGTLPDEFTVTMGQSPPGTSYNEKEEGTPLFQGNADFGFRFPKNRVYTTEPKRFAGKFDTLVSVRAPVGEQNMARESCCIGRGVASFRYKKNQEFYSYTYYKMKSLMKEIKRFDQEGTVFGSISKDDFEKLEIVLPPHNLIQGFQNSVRKIDEKIYLNHSHIRKLESLRDTLLPKLMNGSVSSKAG